MLELMLKYVSTDPRQFLPIGAGRTKASKVDDQTDASPSSSRHESLTWSEKCLTEAEAETLNPNPHRFLPIGAESFQLIGPGGGVGVGRAQNIVSIGGGAVQLKLTSACVPDEKNDKDFVVGPPFKLELFLGSKVLPISEVKDVSHFEP